MANSTIKKFLDAGVHVTEMSKQQAESLVKSLVKSGEMKRKDADQAIQALVTRGKQTTDKISTLVQHEVAKQAAAFSERFDELEDRFEALAKSLINAANKSGSGTESSAPAASTSVANKAPAKKAPAKKAPAKAAPAKKAPAKKAPAKKAPAKAAPAAVGSSGVRKVSTSRKG